MSEVLIRMKMPQCCEKCRFFAWKRGVGQYCAIDDRITFHATLDGFDVGYERNGDCPLVPVPSHGRLIDADELCDGLVSNHPVVIHVNAAPTIIPAEDDKILCRCGGRLSEVRYHNGRPYRHCFDCHREYYEEGDNS